ncbi:hypothetical protein GXM_05219 [Nostoc sphaeroides CCNUC1]|uniref:Uncharacterized protein n=1 Tax=Nostoc sphaeroides CCNUC1 TaxID=2653204 RepID=A0A5P8W4R2_9NOSO|nr:hypothetical protein GXM_05219 [Nostoc sphaeroides CCNUC1]
MFSWLQITEFIEYNLIPFQTISQKSIVKNYRDDNSKELI